MGGGFLVTGGLLVFGVPATFAVGTGLTLVMGSSIINTLKHRRMGNVDFKLGFLMVCGTVPAVFAAEEVINTAPDDSAADALALCLRHVARLHIKCGKKKAGRSLNMEARDLENEVERRKTLARSRHAAAMGEEFERARHEEAKDEGDEGDRGEAGIEQAFEGFATLALGNSFMNEENDMWDSDDGSDDMWHSDDGSDDGSDGGGWNPEDGEDGG